MARPATWWFQIVAVDLRQAFWPWLAYAMTVFILALDYHFPGTFVSDLELGVMASLLLLSPAVLSAVFASDFVHNTIPTLLAFERPRVWLFSIRFATAATLIYAPMVVTAMFLPSLFAVIRQPEISRGNWDALFVILIVASCHLGVAPFLALMLKKPLLVWSAIVISPLVFTLGLTLISTVFNLDLDNDRVEAFPNISISYSLAIVAGSLVSTLLACRQWLRFEVRS